MTGATGVIARAVAVAALAATGCADGGGVTLRPVIELPPATSDAYPMAALDQWTLSIAEQGDPSPLSLQTREPPSPPTLAGVPFGDDLVVHLSGTSAGVEIAYGRTCAVSVPGDVLEPHLYFARTVSWGPAPRPAAGNRRRAGGYQRLDGAAVLAGGADGATAIEVFDPRAGAFSTLASQLAPRDGATLSPLLDGRALIVGGRDPDGALVALAEILDAKSDAIAARSEGVPAVSEHAAATLVDGSVIVAGGVGPAGVTAQAWEFGVDAAGQIAAPRLLFDGLALARAGHTMTRLGDDVGADVLVVGGRDASGAPVGLAELYRPLFESFETIEGSGSTMIAPRWGHRAVRMPGGFVLILGGVDPEPVTQLELYDPGLGTFVDAGQLPEGAGVTGMSATPLPDGGVLIAGGFDAAGQRTASAFVARLDEIDGRLVVVGTDSLDVPRADHTAVPLCDGTILVVGGADDPDAPAERYNPSSTGRR
ncbi:MAG: hypothetical protein D6689_03940 [Deltaproteobacteria bacterium]|nr:MAG: hypothetical protein D6689_03940 [Deltaproteobacteria bacterium]